MIFPIVSAGISDCSSWRETERCLIVKSDDFYDPLSRSLLREIIRILLRNNCPVLLVSATIPDSALAYFSENMPYEPIFCEDTTGYDVVKYNIHKINATYLSEIHSILEDGVKNGNMIIYANTVNHAIEYYDYICNIIKNNKAYTGIPVILYHAMYQNEDKINKELDIVALLGEEAWKKGDVRGIVIMTQIGEMSINIGTTYMVSEMCPADRGGQRIGRECRFNDGIGIFYFVNRRHFTKDGRVENYSMPYGTRNNNVWITSTAYQRTFEFMPTGHTTPGDLMAAINKVYENGFEDTPGIVQNNDRIYKSAIDNLAVISGGYVDEECGYGEYKFRDSLPQSRIYIGEIDRLNSGFDKYREFQIFQDNHSVAVPAYKITQAQKKNLIKIIPVSVPDGNIIDVAWIDSKYYTYEKGLCLI